ncbi:MAG: hypothetical protein ACOX0U_01490 [Oscillospiraceae bacterium]
MSQKASCCKTLQQDAFSHLQMRNNSKVFIEELGTKYNIREIALDRSARVYTTSNLTTQPRQIQKTSKSATDQAPTSKSLCRVQNRIFGLVPKNQYFYDLYLSDFIYKTSKIPYVKPFSYIQSFALDINTTVSTWNDRLTLMSGLYFWFCPFEGIGR